MSQSVTLPMQTCRVTQHSLTGSTHWSALPFIETLFSKLDSFHRSKVRTAPVKPFIITMTPLSVVDQNLLVFIVDLLNASCIPVHTQRVRFK